MASPFELFRKVFKEELSDQEIKSFDKYLFGRYLLGNPKGILMAQILNKNELSDDYGYYFVLKGLIKGFGMKNERFSYMKGMKRSFPKEIKAIMMEYPVSKEVAEDYRKEMSEQELQNLMEKYKEVL